MGKPVKVRGFMHITFEVPYEWEEDVDEIKEWAEDYGKVFFLDDDLVEEFVKSGEEGEYLRNFPNVIPDEHEVWEANIDRVEIIGEYIE